MDAVSMLKRQSHRYKLVRTSLWWRELKAADGSNPPDEPLRELPFIQLLNHTHHFYNHQSNHHPRENILAT